MYQIFLVLIASTAGRSLGVGPSSNVGNQSGECHWDTFLYGWVRKDVADPTGVVEGSWTHRCGCRRPLERRETVETVMVGMVAGGFDNRDKSCAF